MRYKHILASLLAALPLACLSQDTISIAKVINIEASAKPDSLSSIRYHFVRAPKSAHILPLRTAQPLDLHIPDWHFTPGQANMAHWNSGAIVAAGSTRSFPGLMQVDSGELGIHQTTGNLRLYAGGTVNKYGYFGGLHTQYGLNGSISYQFTPRLSATLFGEYYFGQPPRMANGMPMPPAMIGYYSRSTFGGYVDYQINERWGVQTGVQTVQQFGTNRYKAEPIVTPYYKISKKVAIGLPVGQILYHLLK